MSNTAMQEQDYEKDVKVDFSIWKRLLSYVFRYKKTAIALMLCNVGIAVIDILYPLMSQYAIDNFVEKGTTAGIGWFIALYIAFIALQALGVYSFIVKAGKLEMNVSYDMRREAFQKLQELSFSFYDRTAVGYLMARMISDVGSLSEMMAWSFVDLLWASTYVIGVVIAMFAMNWKLALLIMIVIPPLAVISVFFQKKILKYQRRVRKTNSRITGAFNEGIMGAMTTKTLVREDANYSEFKQLSSEMKRDSIRSALLSALFMPIVMFLGSIGTAIALHRGGIDVMGGIITFGTLSAFISHHVFCRKCTILCFKVVNRALQPIKIFLFINALRRSSRRNNVLRRHNITHERAFYSVFRTEYDVSYIHCRIVEFSLISTTEHINRSITVHILISSICPHCCWSISEFRT